MSAGAAAGAMIRAVIASRRQPAAEVQMSGRRLIAWLAPPAALVVAAVALSQFQPGAEAGGRVTPPPAGACSGPAPGDAGAAAIDRGAAGRGTWWRLVERLDSNGALDGKTLFAGRGGSASVTIELGAESSVRGPDGGLIVVANDDGRFSEVRLVDVLQGCSWLVQRADDVVRSAMLDPSDGSIIAHLVRRETRADLGIWRITGVHPDATVERLLEPLAPRPDLGPIWATEFRLDETGTTLAVQSCSDAGCLTRVVALGAFGQPVTLVEGVEQGAIVAIADDRLITWARCVGLPCEILAWEPSALRPVSLARGAVGAAVSGDGRYLVVATDPASGRAFRIDLTDGTSVQVGGLGAGDLPLSVGLNAYAGLDVAPDEIAVAAPGGDARAFRPKDAELVP